MECSNCGTDGHNRTTCPLSGRGGGKGMPKKKDKAQRKYAWCLPGQRPVRLANGSVGMEAEPEKIRCGCGGSYLPTGTAKGAESWRRHHSSDRHMEWEYGPDGAFGGGRGSSDRAETERGKPSEGSIKFEARPEKIRCGCGGSLYQNDGSRKAAEKYLKHMSSDRHMEWENRENRPWPHGGGGYSDQRHWQFSSGPMMPLHPSNDRSTALGAQIEKALWHMHMSDNRHSGWTNGPQGPPHHMGWADGPRGPPPYGSFVWR